MPTIFVNMTIYREQIHNALGYSWTIFALGSPSHGSTTLCEMLETVHILFV